MKGALKAKVNRASKAPLSWRMRNTLRVSYLSAWLGHVLAKAFTRFTGITTMYGQLQARVVRADGHVVDYGVVSYRQITSAGVQFLRDDWNDGASDINTMNYHDSGTSNTAEAAADTTITPAGPARVAGTKSVGSSGANRTFTSAAQVSYTGTLSIVEHGLFSASTAGTLWDRSVFTSIGVNNGDSITFTYTGTLTAGG